jgi:hypothetical protein
VPFSLKDERLLPRSQKFGVGDISCEGERLSSISGCVINADSSLTLSRISLVQDVWVKP